MEHREIRFSIGKKMYVFVITIVLLAIAGIWILSYRITRDQIDRYYKRLTINSARNYASFVDIGYLRELRAAAESSEFQELRDYAEEIDDDSLIQDYLEEHGLWDKYVEQREVMRTYVDNMDDINYLKTVNDNYGHDNGDKYIKGCCHILCDVLKHSPVYRIGGDEFVAVLTGEDYESRNARLADLYAVFEKTYSNKNAEVWDRYSASLGMADYTPADDSVESVFKRADQAMYQYKNQFKRDHENK